MHKRHKSVNTQVMINLSDEVEFVNSAMKIEVKRKVYAE